MFMWATRSSVGYRLLEVTGYGGSLLHDSTALPSASATGGTTVPYADALLTPDGRGLVTTDFRNFASKKGGGVARLRVVELSATTGRLLRVLHVAYQRYAKGPPHSQRQPLAADLACDVLSLGPSGLHALVQCAGFGRLDGNQFIPLPGVPVALASSTQHGVLDLGFDAAW